MVKFPNAKINIGLNIINKRLDGFHNIETVFYPIGLSDVLEIVENEQNTTLTTTGIVTGCSADDNIVLKALRLLQKDFTIHELEIHLHKITPIGAGLGGGSSDAAFMLKTINELYALNLSNDHLAKYARQLGSDCAFFIDNQPVFAFERGDYFESIALNLNVYHLVLVYPNIHVNTRSAYSGVHPHQPAVSLRQLIQLPISDWKHCICNDFEISVFKQFPEIEAVKSKLYDLGAVYAAMSGSGSSVYGIFSTHLTTEILKQNFGTEYFLWQGKL